MEEKVRQMREIAESIFDSFAFNDLAKADRTTVQALLRIGDDLDLVIERTGGNQ